MANRVGRPSVLNDELKRRICAVVAVGGSRRLAARYVGCAPSTITYAAQHDPEFAAELIRAAGQHEMSTLSQVQSAAREHRYWRAAAWVLERLYPARYGQRRVDMAPLKAVARLIDGLAAVVMEEVRDEATRRRVQRRIARLIKETLEQPAAGRGTA